MLLASPRVSKKPRNAGRVAEFMRASSCSVVLGTRGREEVGNKNLMIRDDETDHNARDLLVVRGTECSSEQFIGNIAGHRENKMMERNVALRYGLIVFEEFGKIVSADIVKAIG